MKRAVTHEEKYIQMTQAPISRLVLHLALPSILSMLVSSVYNMADTYFVGQLGTRETAAVGIVFSLMAVIQAVGFTFGHGSGNYIARVLGARDHQTAAAMAVTGAVSSFLVGCFITIIGLLFLEPLVYLMGATQTIAPSAKQYAFFILLGAPFMSSSFTLNNQLRYQGNAFYGMIALCVGGVLNIALDPLFIFTLGLGVGGAALATISSQIFSFSLLLWGTTRGGSMRVNPLRFRPQIWQYKEILRGGMPSLWRQGLQSLSAVALNLAANPYGDAALAAVSIVTRVTGLLFSTILGFGQGFQPVCGFNYGAKLVKRVQKAFKFSVTVSTVVLTVVCALCFLFAEPIVAAFRRDDAQVIQIGTQMLRFQLMTYPLMGFTTIAMMMTQTIGMPVRASILAAARQGIFFLPLIAVLPGMFGLRGVMASQPAADLLAFILAIIISKVTIREMNTLS